MKYILTILLLATHLSTEAKVAFSDEQIMSTSYSDQYTCEEKNTPTCKVVCAIQGTQQPFVKSNITKMTITVIADDSLMIEGESKTSEENSFYGYFGSNVGCMVFGLNRAPQVDPIR